MFSDFKIPFIREAVERQVYTKKERATKESLETVEAFFFIVNYRIIPLKPNINLQKLPA